MSCCSDCHVIIYGVHWFHQIMKRISCYKGISRLVCPPDSDWLDLLNVETFWRFSPHFCKTHAGGFPPNGMQITSIDISSFTVLRKPSYWDQWTVWTRSKSFFAQIILTIVIKPLPVPKWHIYLDEPTIADAIMDRIIPKAHRIELKGESLRKKL